MPAILYSLVARGTTVLAEQTQEGIDGNFANVTRVLLKKIDPTRDSKQSYAYDEHTFHYVVTNGLTTLCMTDRDTPRVQAFQFLLSAESEFLRQFGSRWQTAVAYKFDGDFKVALRRLMASHSGSAASPADPKVAAINAQLEDIRGTMSKNIELVLERGEKIELLVAKTEVMEEHANKFHKSARKVKRKFCLQNFKWMLLLALAVLALIYMILAFSCGGPALPKCHK